LSWEDIFFFVGNIVLSVGPTASIFDGKPKMPMYTSLVVMMALIPILLANIGLHFWFATTANAIGMIVWGTLAVQKFIKVGE
jgi:hypothetical protein